MIGLLFGHGSSGVPRPEPLDFARLPAPASPNWWVALPSGETAPGARWQTHTPRPASAEALWRAVLATAAATPRCFPLADWPERRQAQWVVRSALMNFPDIVVAEIAPRPQGAALRLHSRSLMGWSDQGVNQRRVADWLAAIDAALAASPG